MPSTSLKQKGVMLPIALILLVVISILGIMAMRNATVGEQTINAVRTNAATRAAAEMGLRHCEAVVYEISDKPTIPLYAAEAAKIALKGKDGINILTGQNDANALWTVAANWKSTSAYRISMMTANSGFKNPPKCMIEKVKFASGEDGYLITSRGIGNEAEYDDSTGLVKSGAEIWLQSVLMPKTS